MEEKQLFQRGNTGSCRAVVAVRMDVVTYERKSRMGNLSWMRQALPDGKGDLRKAESGDKTPGIVPQQNLRGGIRKTDRVPAEEK